MRRIRLLGLLVGTALTVGACSRGGLAPKGDAADRIYDVTLVLTVVGVLVTAVSLAAWAWAVRRSRTRAGEADEPGPVADADSTERLLVIGGGIVMPAVVMAALFGFGVWNMGSQPTGGEFEVDVIGHQFWWEVTYRNAPGAPGTFTTANEIHLPVGTEVTMRLTSDDVIHSFFVPELAGKMDLMPGRTNELVFTVEQAGTYEGFCAEFCGIQHAWMKFEVVGDDPDQFATWAAGQAADAREPTTELQARGRDVFVGNSCVGCHALRGVAEDADVGPDLTHLASRGEIGAGLLDLDADNLADWIANAQTIKGGSKMPPQQLDAADMDALVAYLLTLE